MHILLDDPKKAEQMKKELLSAPNFTEKFSKLASSNSICLSKHDGGSLGIVRPGTTAEEFDKVCFQEETEQVHGPVETEFGYHLIYVEERWEA
ncbi:hypothetical protein CYMTET_45030 [Cymbomonas tetramitiformis]|uniref:Peptidyl-prolyl cis-trans isomerase n=1 Tax=Cymbomonas tetramitiformis TaxID=36881 RepID=A0AAE0BZ18_9CHLO|nr:hypothetical protein CYMTET_45030 [Cymbomonas tetramitiformis]